MRDEGDQDKIKSIKKEKEHKAKAAKDLVELERLDALAMHESVTVGDFVVTAVLAGWLYTLIDKNGDLIHSTFVGDDR